MVLCSLVVVCAQRSAFELLPNLYASTQPHAYAFGGAAQLDVGNLMVRVSGPSALHRKSVSYYCSPGNALRSPTVPSPNSSNLDGYTPSQDWSANLHK